MTWSTEEINAGDYPARGTEIHLKGVLAVLAVDGAWPRPKESEVELRVREIASRFNSRVVLREGAPRRGTMIRRLEEVKSACARAARALEELDDATLLFFCPSSALMLGGGEIVEHAFSEATQQALRQAFSSEIETTMGGQTPSRELVGSLKLRLDALARLAELAIPVLETDVPPDSGGPSDFIQQTQVSPEWGLVIDCWDLATSVGVGAKLSGYIRNPTGRAGIFIELIVALYRFATGDDEAVPRNLERRVQSAVKIQRSIEHLEVQLQTSANGPRWAFMFQLAHEADEARSTGNVPLWLIDGWESVLATARSWEDFEAGLERRRKSLAKRNDRKRLKNI